MTEYYVKRDDGKLYVRTNNSGIPALVILIDGLKITTFKGLTSKYISVDVALGWHKKELEYGLENDYHKDSIEHHKEAIRVLTDALEKNKGE